MGVSEESIVTVSAKHPDIVVVQLGDSLPTQLAEKLRERGYAVHLLSKLNEICASWDAYRDPILVVDCSRSITVAERTVTTLAEHRHTLRCPIILATLERRRFGCRLGRYFSVCTTLALPCGLDEVVAMIGAVERAVERLGGKARLALDPHSPPDYSESEESSVDAGKLASVSDFLEVDPGHARGGTDLLFSPRARLSLRGDELCGDDLLAPRVFSEIEAGGLAPIDPRCLAAGRELVGRTDRLGRRQVLRTVVLVGRLMRALGLPEELRDVGASAALLYGLSVGEDDARVLTSLYLSKRSSAIRKQFCQSIRASAERVARDLERQDVARVLSSFASIVEGKPCEDSSPETLELGTILFGAELIGRVCFQSGWWNPRHAGRILERLERGWIHELQPALASALVRVVTAAITEHPRGFVVPMRLRCDPVLIERALSHRYAKPGRGESSVPLADLLPGMRLSRPVETFDGRRLLENDIRLDHDIIWRLWRLAAICPLNAPVFVTQHLSNDS